jgi:hypothetical protein
MQTLCQCNVALPRLHVFGENLLSTWTQSDIDALRAAVKTGARVVKYADRTVEYHDLAAMRSLLAEMVAAVAAASGGKPYTLATTRKGLDC